MSFESYCQTVARNFEALGALEGVMVQAADIWVEALKNGNKIIFCGNGGSAADSQHLAAELVGRYILERESLPSIALTVDSSALTAIANDYGYEQVFARQLSGLGKAGDVFVGITTSGNSGNILAAVKVARKMGIKVMGFTGKGGGQLAEECDLCIKVPSDTTNHIQEMHIAVGHYLCGVTETRLCSVR
ncbi:D-sedoheptulose 7-phosphate isomerase [Kiloniella laminariae]|uniref:Phosphoheptose isomerase n=1 Tax=Kiloniella laminariae TaxID=454162 RepID=A0ABT4LFR3_9PROT|nr:D-sedoheptulose 7-phosphate isomerase [Kiloniella laminariae]MCZ4279181.1 D-sedoheptulose 7-phosphate isomerase [Kiloniella laminariae]